MLFRQSEYRKYKVMQSFWILITNFKPQIMAGFNKIRAKYLKNRKR